MNNNLPATQEPAVQDSAVANVESNRAIHEVQAAMTIAQKFPRNHNTVYTRIMESCKRKKLAEQAMYAYPRGSQVVTGPSIRLAEVLAQSYQNLDFGIRELEQKNGESVVQAYCWDLETNVKQTKVFTVPHIRYSKKKGNTKLTDPRDIYEMVANQGARRLRACILGVIPGDLTDSAVEQCEKTLKIGCDEPIKDRIRSMVAAFKEKGVSEEMIAKRLGHNMDVTIESELIQLRKIYQSIKDGMAKRQDYFDFGKEPTEGNAAELEERLKKSAEKRAEAKKVKEPSKPVEGKLPYPECLGESAEVVEAPDTAKRFDDAIQRAKAKSPVEPEGPTEQPEPKLEAGPDQATLGV